MNVNKVDLAFQMTRVTAEKNRLQSEYKAGTVQLRAAQVTIFMNLGVSTVKMSHWEAFMLLKRMLLCLSLEVAKAILAIRPYFSTFLLVLLNI